MLAKPIYRRAARNPHLLVFLVPLTIYLLCRWYARTHFYRDPTSPYFDVKRGYEPIYSTIRKEEALAFVKEHNTSTASSFHRQESHKAPWMCIGMNTISRPSGAVYARWSLASWITGLTQEERDQLFFMPMIGHINATDHPIYTEPWLEKLADRVLTYQESKLMTPEHLKHIEELELERQRTGVPDREKHLGDYTHLLRECAATNAPYVLMLEDDVLALDGWFHRVRAAINEIERRTKEDENGWFYLRLFYTEHSQGWRDEEIPKYIAYATSVGLCILFAYILGFVYLRSTVWGKPLIAKYAKTTFFVLAMSFGLFTYLFFSVGKESIWPPRAGVREMPRGGCCAQGIVYPSSKIEKLTAWYEESRIGFVDTLAERLANEKPHGIEIGSRWALRPVLLQHIGGQSSKGDNWGTDKPGQMSEAQRLWNFQYETNDPKQLAREHKSAAERFKLLLQLQQDD